MDSILVVCVGNPFRSDDAVGLKVASRLSDQNDDRFQIVKIDSDLLTLLDLWKDKYTIIVDAVNGSPKDPLVFFDGLDEIELHRERLSSTHGISIFEVIELGKILDKMPSHLQIIGIPGDNYKLGMSSGEELSRKINLTVDFITQRMS